ncbi:hypothetical protein R3P38DRAFT_2850646, partial [Favolaschia claudopus]
QLSAIEITLNQRDRDLLSTQQQLSALKKSNSALPSATSQGPLAKTESQLSNSTQRNESRSEAHRLGKCLSKAHRKIGTQEEKLKQTKSQLRRARRETAESISLASHTRTRQLRERRARKAAQKAFVKEKAAHEALKETTSQLITIVESLEAQVADSHPHSHNKGRDDNFAQCKFRRKYEKLKAKNRVMKMAESV